MNQANSSASASANLSLATYGIEPIDDTRVASQSASAIAEHASATDTVMAPAVSHAVQTNVLDGESGQLRTDDGIVEQNIRNVISPTLDLVTQQANLLTKRSVNVRHKEAVLIDESIDGAVDSILDDIADDIAFAWTE